MDLEDIWATALFILKNMYKYQHHVDFSHALYTQCLAWRDDGSIFSEHYSVFSVFEVVSEWKCDVGAQCTATEENKSL